MICACLESGAVLRHDHVYERAKMADRLMTSPNELDEILDLAIGCVVTKDEHAHLTAISRQPPGLDGWDRYRAAGIKVVDMLSEQGAGRAGPW